MQKIAIIDIGSNSLRLVLVQVTQDGFYKIINDLKESVRLGEGMTEKCELQAARVAEAIQTLSMFKQICDSVQTSEIIAVATEAVRKATNRQAFLERVKTEVGINVRVLSGDEEAYFGYLGVIHSLDLTEGLIMDLGGSSTELVWLQEQKIKEKVSLPFGAINLTDRFKLQNKITKEQEKQLLQYLNSYYRTIPWLAKLKGSQLIGIGGTIRNFGKIDRKRKNYPLDIAHNYRLKPNDIHEIYDLVKNKSLAQRQAIRGLSKARADIFVGGAAAVAALVNFCKLKEVIVSGKGLREGLLYDYLSRHYQPIMNAFNFSLHNNLANYQLDVKHAAHVCHLTKSLFTQLRNLHHLDSRVERILKAAAMLHDCGIAIRFYEQRKHVFYVILHSEINVLSHRELVMSAAIASYNLKNDYKENLTAYKTLKTIQKLGILLQIAANLDRGRNGNITNIKCAIENDVVIIKTMAQNNPLLEIRNAMQAADHFRKIFKKKLLIV